MTKGGKNDFEWEEGGEIIKVENENEAKKRRE